MRIRLVVVVTAILGALSSPVMADDVGAAARGVVRVISGAKDGDQASVSVGSGFAISPHHIVTSAHVVSNAVGTLGESLVAVVPSEGSRALHGTIVAYDQEKDLAVIDVGETRLEPLAIYTGPVDSGAHAAALGYPGNVDLATDNSIYDLIAPTTPVRSEGNISNARTIGGKSALLHTAPMSRGNSGGPLVDSCGRVLGVNTYLTRNDEGDSAFGFAIVSQELLTFLRVHGEQFQQIGTPCVSFAEQGQRQQQVQDAEAKQQAAAEQRAAVEQARQSDAAKAKLEDARENHTMSAGLLILFSVIAGALSATLFVKDRTKPGGAAAMAATIGLAGAAYAFFTRPALNVNTPVLTSSASAETAPLSGRLLCRVKPELSRVTVSSTEDVVMNWDPSGCMNGRTQYVQEGANWRKVLVPNGSETVFVQDFDPVKHEYVSTRYLLPQTDMAQLRGIRAGNLVKSCKSDPGAAQQLEELTNHLVSSLPSTPNEKLVYQCGH